MIVRSRIQKVSRIDRSTRGVAFAGRKPYPRAGRGLFYGRSPTPSPTEMKALLAPALLLVCAPLATSDVVELEDGTTLDGYWLEDTSTHIVFQVRGESKARKLKHSAVVRLELTFPSEEERIAADPRWSPEKVQKTTEQYFLPEEHGDVDLVRSDHYIIFSTASGADRVAKAMEEIYQAFDKTYPFEEPEGEALLPVFLLKDHGQYTEWSMRATGWTRAEAARSAGHASGKYFSTYFTGGATAVVYHEAGHQLVHNRLRLNGGGSWFQEGMAVYFEDKWKKSKGLSSVASGMIKSDRYTPFRELFEVKSLLHSDGDNQRGSIAGQRYTQSGTIICFLAEGPLKKDFGKMLDALRNYRRSRKGGTVSERSLWDGIFKEAYGLDVDGVEAAWKKYFVGR